MYLEVFVWRMIGLLVALQLQDYAAMVNMQHEQNEFRGAQNKAILALVTHVGTVLEPAFSAMSKVPWSMHPDVGDHSKYVDMMNDVFTNNISKYAENLNGTLHGLVVGVHLLLFAHLSLSC